MTDLIVVLQPTQWQRLKALVLDSVSSPITKRVYNLGLDEFFAWFSQEPRHGFTKATVSAWRVALEARGLGSVSINVRITAVRKLAAEAAVEGQGAELGLGSAGTILDDTTRRQYKNRGEVLMRELAEAKRNNDWVPKEEIEMELEQMAKQLASATGLGGRERKASDDIERARRRVSNAIRRAVDGIREHHHELADHLHHYIERGQFCCYRGDGIDWQL
jgi:hypothetical protein